MKSVLIANKRPLGQSHGHRWDRCCWPSTVGGGSDQASVCGELPPQPERGDQEPPPPSTTSCVPAARRAARAAGHGSSWRSRSWSSTRCRRAGPAGPGHSWPAPAGRHSPCWGPGAGRPALRDTGAGGGGERVVRKLRVAGNTCHVVSLKESSSVTAGLPKMPVTVSR